MNWSELREMEPWLTILGLGTIVFLVGLWFQHNERKSRRLEENRSPIEARLMAIENELKRICQVLGRHDAILREHDVEIEILKQK